MEPLLTDTVISRQLHLRLPSQNPVHFPNSHTNSVFLHSRKRPAPAVTETFFASRGCPLTRISTVSFFLWVVFIVTVACEPRSSIAVMNLGEETRVSLQTGPYCRENVFSCKEKAKSNLDSVNWYINFIQIIHLKIWYPLWLWACTYATAIPPIHVRTHQPGMVRGGSPRKRYLSQASVIWKGRDFTCWSIWKFRPYKG